MLWMQTYFFYCSVRLGVIIVSFLTLLQLLGPAVLLLSRGISLLDSLIDVFAKDEQFNKNIFINKLLQWIDDHPENVITFLNSVLFIHMGTCFLAFYAALRLSKYFLIPLIGMEFMRVVICLAFHIILMIILKKIINLGVLIALTLLGGFIILYLAYNWCTCVALFQIINLVHSNRYRQLYGEDPFSPNLLAKQQSPKRYSRSTLENIHVITTPNGSDIDELKRKSNNNWQLNYNSQYNQHIISVLPYHNNLQNVTRNPNLKNVYHKAKPEFDKSLNYGYWHWSELLVKGAHHGNGLIAIKARLKR